jgi:hypothetical protein
VVRTADAWARVESRLVYTESGCWEWTGAIVNGYGQAKIGHRLRGVHRFSYEHHVGPVPAGLEIDHLCKNKRCCNPAHLEAVTHRENVLRGESPSAKYARATHCKHGHEWTPENTGRDGSSRRCLTCKRKRQIEYKRRRKERERG